jgi:hypothetical protein
LPFSILFDFEDRIISNPNMDPLLVIAITLPSLVMYVIVMIYFARKWSIAWNEKINKTMP